MADPLYGTNVGFEVWSGSDYLPVICATNIAVSVDEELIEVTDVNAGHWKKFKSRRREWSITLSSISHVVTEPLLAYNVFDTLLEQFRAAGVDARIKYIDAAGNIKTLSGHVLVEHTGINSPMDNFSEDDITFRGSGELVLNTTLITPTTLGEMFSITLFGDGANDYVQSNTLIGKNVAAPSGAVIRGYPLEVITSGTPSAGQAKFDAGTGRIYFSTTVDLGELIEIWYK